MTTTEAARLLVESMDRIRDLNSAIRHPPIGFSTKAQLDALDEASDNVRKAIRELCDPNTIC